MQLWQGLRFLTVVRHASRCSPGRALSTRTVRPDSSLQMPCMHTHREATAAFMQQRGVASSLASANMYCACLGMDNQACRLLHVHDSSSGGDLFVKKQSPGHQKLSSGTRDALHGPSVAPLYRICL